MYWPPSERVVRRMKQLEKFHVAGRIAMSPENLWGVEASTCARYGSRSPDEPERLPGGVLGRMMAPLTSRIVRRNYRADLARLKDILEAEVEARECDELMAEVAERQRKGHRVEAQQELDGAYERSGRMAVRNQLLAGLPVTERRLDLRGCPHRC